MELFSQPATSGTLRVLYSEAAEGGLYAVDPPRAGGQLAGIRAFCAC